MIFAAGCLSLLDADVLHHTPVDPASFSGSRQSTDLVVSRSYADFGVTWNITATAGGFRYEYFFEGVTKDISHILFEVSATCGPSCIESWAPWLTLDEDAPRTYAAHGPSNPDLPEDIFGVKFDFDDNAPPSVCFTSPRAPMWGDFYVKSGKRTYAYNAGLESPWSGYPADFIPVPDTMTAVVPEPASLLLCAAAVAASLLWWRRRSR